MIPKDKRAGILAEIAAGLSPRDAARKYGVHTATFRNWRAEIKRGGGSGTQSPTTKAHAVPPPPPSAPQPENRGGYEAARASAGLGTGSPVNPSPGAAVLPTQFVTPDDVANAADAVTAAIIKGGLGLAGIDVNDKMDKLCLLTAGERSTIKILSPAALPHLNEALIKTKENSLLILAGVYLLFLAQRGVQIYRILQANPELRRRAKPKEAPVKPKGEEKGTDAKVRDILVRGGHGDGENESGMGTLAAMGS